EFRRVLFRSRSHAAIRPQPLQAARWALRTMDRRKPHGHRRGLRRSWDEPFEVEAELAAQRASTGWRDRERTAVLAAEQPAVRNGCVRQGGAERAGEMRASVSQVEAGERERAAAGA